jgi:hypothetical protein
VAGGLDRGRRVWLPWQESWLSSARAKCGGDLPVPEEALESTKEDVEWLKTQARSARP